MKDYRSQPPASNPTKPFWQTPPNTRLENYKSYATALYKKYLMLSSSSISQDVNIVIIGSGLTGALIAYNILSRAGPKPSVLMLEARAACSGATGRNGGHLKPDCCRGFDGYAKLHGVETALKQCHFEAANLEAMIDFIRENGLEDEVDLVECDTVDTYMSEATWAWGLKSVRNFEAAGGNVSRIKIYEGEEAKKVTRVPGCLGAISYPAASLWPYKLTIAILSKAIDLGLKLQTHTPVTAIVSSPSGWKVTTPVLEIKTQKVIHATNGYSSLLLPELTGRIVPLKGHVAAIPPSSYFTTNPVNNTSAFVWDVDYDYLIQRQVGVKELILGGRDSSYPECSGGPLGDSDDSSISEEFANRLRAFPKENFEGWGEDPAGLQEAKVWSGIMGVTNDSLPFLGELPGKKGQYVAAGYNGHGMARIFLSVKAFCERLYGEEIDKRIPEVYFDLERRLKDPIDLVKTGWSK